MSFGFSAGDFVVGISLIKDLTDALSETHGSKAEYRGLITELYYLQRALIAIKEIEVQQNSREYDATQLAVRGCQECIDGFLLKIASYQSLAAGKSSIKDHVKKITWSQCRKEDLRKFKEDLSIYTAAINVLLHTLQLSVSKNTNTTALAGITTQTEILRDVEDSIKDSTASHTEILQRIEGLLGERRTKLPETPAPNFLIMSEMEEHLLPISADKQTLLVLSGPGGIGKSQLARDYASRHRHDYDAVFWTNGKSEQSLRVSIARIAELIPLPHVLDPDQKILKNEGDINRAMHAVELWLTANGNCRWLIIIDNVDNQVDEDSSLELSGGIGGFDVTDYIPAVTHGTFIITSRLSLLSRNIGAQNILVGEMDREEALQVLQKASGRSYDEEGDSLSYVLLMLELTLIGAGRLVEKLGAYPLALIQAAKYIYENHTTTQIYLERYEKDRKLLLEQRPFRREYNGGSIDVALRLSFDTLRGKKPEAAAFLLLCGFLDYRDIFWSLLNRAYLFHGLSLCRGGAQISFGGISSDPFEETNPGWLDQIARDEAEFDAVAKYLYELSFIRWNEESDGFSIHAIIHQWIDTNVDCLTRAKLLTLASDIVASNYGAKSDTPSQRIRPHADRCVSLGNLNNSFQTWIFPSLILLGTFFYDDGDLIRAQQLIRCALEKVAATYGDESEMTALWCMRISPMFIHCQPIEVLIRDLLAAEIILTSPSVSLNRIIQNLVDMKVHLCYAYQMKGDFVRATAIAETAVEIATQGKVEPIFTCSAVGLLAECYLAIGKYESAKSYAKTAIGQHKQIFGTDPKDGSLSAWRSRTLTIKAIACTHLGEFGLAELILASVYSRAVKYNRSDAPLSLHAQRNLQILREAKARKEAASVEPHNSVLSATSENTLVTWSLDQLSTDRDITYLRFDLAMGMFCTLWFVDAKIRERAKGGFGGPPVQPALNKIVTPLSARLAATTSCLVQ